MYANGFGHTGAPFSAVSVQNVLVGNVTIGGSLTLEKRCRLTGGDLVTVGKPKFTVLGKRVPRMFSPQ
jgi:hypothetical protein